jgi:outer membrane receptor protein involved in Fe transport
MSKTRLFFGIAALCAFATAGPTRLSAQGVTTGSLTGSVTDDADQLVEAAQVQLRNPATGYTIGATTRANGTYLISGIEPDANYVIVVRRIGFEPITRNHVVITLNQTRREDFKLSKQAAVLSAVTISATTDPVINASKTGTATTVSDSALRRLPTLNRNFSDFVSLVPQVSTTVGIGLSGGGVNLRQNAIQIDGAQAGDMFGIGTSGQPGSQANAKSIPLDAVKEYQVLLSPFDVRQGNFGGLLINAITKSGTNEFHGSFFGYTRNQSLSRKQSYLTDFSQQQYGGSLGGPILKDRLFFFVSGDFQHLQTPAAGPYIGSSDSPIQQPAITELANATAKYGLPDPGNGFLIQKQNPNQNVFARIDAFLPWNTRLVLRDNYARADNTTFSRGAATAQSPNFNLSSNAYQFSTKTNSVVAEFLTNLPSGLFNELLFNRTTTSDFRTVPVRSPQLTVRGIPRTDGAGGTVSFVMGTEASSQGNTLDQRTFEVTDNFTVPIGAHSLTVGVKDQFYRPINLFGQNSLGSWTFADLASLNAGVASTYSVSAPIPSDPAHGISTFHASMLAYYAQDAWQVTPTFSLTAGIRFDTPDFSDVPPENASVFTSYARHTSSVPHETQISPRVGFNWDMTGDQANQLRGGIGQFTGPPPFVYLANAFGNSGLSGYASLTCTGSTTGATSLAVPVFNAGSVNTPPTACAAAGGKPGATVATSAAVNTIDPSFKFPKYTKASLGYDHRFMGNIIGTIEGLYTRSANNVFYQNLALAGLQGTDAHGRAIYGTLTTTGGTARTTGNRTQVLDMTNSSGDYTWSVTGQLQKSFTKNFEGSVAYTHQEARDVTSTTSSTAGSNYRFQRDVSGLLSDLSVTRSKYDQPHRIVATGTYRLPTYTDLSVIYTGNSGAPFDYVYLAGSGTGSGDANADGNSANDLVYVPKNATDQTEILFTGYNGTAADQAKAAAQASAFDKFIGSMDCLSKARGTIMTRNACRNPWVNEIDISIAQGLGRRFQNLQARIDVINFGNLLNKNWGQQAFSDQGSTCGQICSATALLTQTGNKVNSPTDAVGIYTFDYQNFKAFNNANTASNYRIQLSMRYSF